MTEYIIYILQSSCAPGLGYESLLIFSDNGWNNKCYTGWGTMSRFAGDISDRKVNCRLEEWKEAFKSKRLRITRSKK